MFSYKSIVLILSLSVGATGCWRGQFFIADEVDTTTETGDPADTETQTDSDSTTGVGEWEWTKIELPATADLTDVWGTSPINIYVTGKQGTLLHFDGTQWSQIELPPGSLTGYYGVHGRSADNIWVAGFGGSILGYDGTTWVHYQLTGGEDLYDICAGTEQYTYAVGKGGAFMVHDGIQWIGVDTGYLVDYQAVLCKPYFGAIAVGHLSDDGASSTIISYDGLFTTIDHASVAKLFSIIDTPEMGMMAAAWNPGNLDVPSKHTVLRESNPQWLAHSTGSDLIRKIAHKAGKIWAVGRSNPDAAESTGVVMWRLPEETGTWTVELLDEGTSSFEGFWSESDDVASPIYVVGNEGAMYKGMWYGP